MVKHVANIAVCVCYSLPIWYSLIAVAVRRVRMCFNVSDFKYCQRPSPGGKCEIIKKTCIVILSTCRVHPSREMWNVVNFKIGATTKKKHNDPRGEVDDDIHSGTLVPDYAHAIARPTRRHVPKNASRFLNRLFDSVLDSVFRRNSSHLHIMQAACDMWHVCCNNIR